MDSKYKTELCDRLFNFSVNVLSLLKNLRKNDINKIFRNQLGRSATSAGANYEESQAGISQADFLNKIRISLKEMREANYWLRLLKEVNEDPKINDNINILINESEELKKILGSIVNKRKE